MLSLLGHDVKFVQNQYVPVLILFVFTKDSIITRTPCYSFNGTP